jgi:hypothetical protein
MNNLHSINHEQRLYVLTEGKGYTCLGFDYAEKRRVAVLKWLGQDVTPVEVGTEDAYKAYEAALAAGRQHNTTTGKMCPADLIPQLDIYVGWRVEVRSTDGTKRRFNVSRSTGWVPCNIEVYNRRSLGGPSAYLAPGDEVIPIRQVR